MATSGAYTYSYARASAAMARMYLPPYRVRYGPDGYGAAGTYTVIVSAFETTHLGAFTIKVESDVHVNLEPIPPEGAGMFHKMIRGEW